MSLPILHIMIIFMIKFLKKLMGFIFCSKNFNIYSFMNIY